MENERLDTEVETTSVDTETETNDVNFSGMSDEEFINYLNGDSDDEPVDDDTKTETEVETETEPEPEPVQQTEPEPEPDTETQDEPETAMDLSSKDKDLLQKIFNEGFKAKGKIVKPKTIEEFLSLAQQGVDYNTKNREINNSKRQLKSLTDAGITSLEELNFALDLYKGNPDAIKKLVKDKNIELYDLEEENQYNFNTGNIASESSVEFNDMIESVREKPYFGKLEQTLLRTWDESSRHKVLGDNTILQALIEEFDLERFDTITELVDHERAFGRLKGLNDLEAYSKMAYHYELEQERKKEKLKEKEQTRIRSTDVDVNKNSVTQTKGIDSSKPIGKQYTDKELASLSDKDFLKLYNSGALDN